MERYTKINADDISERFCIGTDKTKDTIMVTTKRGAQYDIISLE